MCTFNLLYRPIVLGFNLMAIYLIICYIFLVIYFLIVLFFQVNNAMNAQPSLLDNLTAVVSHFLSIVSTMHQRCSSSLEVLCQNF